MDVKLAPKQTELEAAPNDWEVKPLGKFIALQRGYDLTERDRRSGEVPVIGSAGLSGFHDKALVRGPGVVLGRSGASFGQAHYCASHFWPHNTAMFVTDFFGNYPLFAFYLLKSMNFTRYNSGGAQQSLNRNFIAPIIVRVPRRKEQEVIAGALRDADALIDSIEQLLVKKRNLKRGAMQELLTGKRRLPGFSQEWKEQTLLDLAGRRKDLFDDGDWIESEHITDEGIRLVQTGNIGIGMFVAKDDKKYISEQSFVSLHCKEIRQADLLICRLADPAGRACILPDIGETKIVTSVDVTIFRPPASAANRVFLVNVFSTELWFRAVSDRSGGTTRKRISRGALGRLRIRIPSVEEQTAIALILSEMDAEITALEAKLAKAIQLKQGMMQELLTGRVRLV